MHCSFLFTMSEKTNSTVITLKRKNPNGSVVDRDRLVKKVCLGIKRGQEAVTYIEDDLQLGVVRMWNNVFSSKHEQRIMRFFLDADKQGFGDLERKPGIFDSITPRDTCSYGDNEGIILRYGAAVEISKKWPSVLESTRRRVEAFTGKNYNYCLVNVYRDGNDCVHWHQDNESILVPRASIASVSFGVTRKFQVKEDHPGRIPITSIPMRSRSLLEMKGTIQETHRHRVPKEKGIEGIRINITFRSVREPINK